MSMLLCRSKVAGSSFRIQQSNKQARLSTFNLLSRRLKCQDFSPTIVVEHEHVVCLELRPLVLSRLLRFCSASKFAYSKELEHKHIKPASSTFTSVVEGWDPRCAAILSKAPSCVDWKLVYRDPLPKWISKGARLALIGDAAHPFLPTSIQGASQAVEDGVTLAVVLQMAGKQGIPLAVRAWEKIRYQRVRRAQVLGETNRDMWHKAKPSDKGNSVELPRPEWLLGFDAEKHAYDVFEIAASEIREKGYVLPTLPLTTKFGFQ
ncbi:hypothetical protein EW145_g5093 [Phellinidium pouzarii]|uniref:FAD-binding domain-containing protein n=1 Tax=Phellinidium pouzarii TaxID=167371 RepID=A0A4S4L1G4_9AGAM|nr:hypothetical protein EW145_g5093 [Phellinidium pouzarii]